MADKFSKEHKPFSLSDAIKDRMHLKVGIDPGKQMANEIKLQAVAEIRALHQKSREKVNSQCETLINISVLDEYEESLK